MSRTPKQPRDERERTGRSPDVRGATETDRLPTGIAGLDTLLRGGFRRAGLHVVVGRPGVGKSVLAHQAGARVVRDGGSVLYLTVLVETNETLISQARTFSFFDRASVGRGFYYASLYPSLERAGLQGMRDEVGRLVREREPQLLVIDGLHALKLAARSRLDYQRFVHELEAMSAVTGVTILFLTHPRGSHAADPTYTIADGVLRLSRRQLQLRTERLLTVTKMRGVNAIDGSHGYAITKDGIQLYPRLEALVQAHGLVLEGGERTLHDVAIDGFAELTGGGLPNASITLVNGTPGSGKTMLSLAFMAEGARRKEPGLYFSFHDLPDRMLMKAESVGLKGLARAVRDGLVRIQRQSPGELFADELAGRMLEEVDRRGVKRLVIDTLGELQRSSELGGRSMPFLTALTDSLRARRVTAVLVQDLPRIVGPTFDLPFGEVSSLMDNMVHTRFVEIGGELRRAIVVLKMREQGYDSRIREYLIGPKGMRVGDRLSRAEAILSGIPRATRMDD